MDDIGEDDISDTQFNDIGEDWSQRDSFSQSDETDKKRKREDDESTIQQKYQRVSVIVPNPNVPQFGAGGVEPENEKNPKTKKRILIKWNLKRKKIYPT